MSDIRAWLEESADQFMRNSMVTVTFPIGVRNFTFGVECPQSASTPIERMAQSRILFTAELADGTAMTTVREPR